MRSPPLQGVNHQSRSVELDSCRSRDLAPARVLGLHEIGKLALRYGAGRRSLLAKARDDVRSAKRALDLGKELACDFPGRGRRDEGAIPVHDLVAGHA